MKEKLVYKNPIIFADCSDPDVIRVGGYFYMVTSSFNFVPGVPLFRSENLVEWELINYVVKEIPFGRFNGKVCAGDGAWAPSVREYDGRFYCLIPFPDEGVYVAEADDIEGDWSPLRPLIKGKGIIDPCPVWDNGKCFVAVAFARSRAGFNSRIGVYEVSPNLTGVLSDGYKIVYDGANDNPVIEGPKFYKRGEYFYILAPAGSVKSGWQVALRSKNVYGPYESKVVLMQGDTLVNGPHQGALVDTPDGRDWFLHFQDMRPYGRVVHLQPVQWQDGWCVCGKPTYDGLAGTPVSGGEYPVQTKTGAHLPLCEDFIGGLSLMWQTPSNFVENGRITSIGYEMPCRNFAERIEELPYALTAAVLGREFVAECDFELRAESDGDEVGFGIIGKNSVFVSLVRDGDGYKTRLVRSGERGEEIVLNVPTDGCEATVAICGVNCDIYRLRCSFCVNGKPFGGEFFACEGVWVGARFALFARNKKTPSCGSGVFKRFLRSPK